MEGAIVTEARGNSPANHDNPVADEQNPLSIELQFDYSTPLGSRGYWDVFHGLRPNGLTRGYHCSSPTGLWNFAVLFRGRMPWRRYKLKLEIQTHFRIFLWIPWLNFDCNICMDAFGRLAPSLLCGWEVGEESGDDLVGFFGFFPG